MKKIILIFLSFISSSILISAQSWEPLGSGLKGIGVVNSLSIYNGKLIVGGSFDTAGGTLVNNIAAWGGTSWTSLSGGLLGGSPGPSAVCLCVYNGELIVGGSFTSAGGNTANNIAAWNGTSWNTIGSGIGAVQVYALAVYKGDLIAAGNMGTAGGNPVNNIAKWNGTAWIALGSGVNNFVLALDTFQGNLYAGGYFDSAGGVYANKIAIWNGSSWSSVSTGIGRKNGLSVNGLDNYNGQLFAEGDFDTVGGIQAKWIASWNGTSWSTLIGGVINGAGVTSIEYNNALIVSGDFDSAGGFPTWGIAQWNGTSWSSFGNRLNHSPYSFAIYNGNLYAGGAFDSAGGYRVNNITEWCDTCKPLGVMEAKTTNEEVRIFPNPNNGVFQLVISNEQLVINNTVEIYNMFGEKVYSNYQIIKSSNCQIDLSGKPAGIYLYRLISETGEQIGTGKFIIQK